MSDDGQATLQKRPLGSVTTSVSSGKTTHRDPGGRKPLYGSTGQIGVTNRIEFTGPSILVARVGANAGSVYSVDGEYGVTDNTLVIRPRSDQSVTFLTEVLQHANLNRLVYGSGQPLVTGTILKNFEIPDLLPAEQGRVAAVLDDANNLIAALERLIAKKQAVRQGMMHQLLGGNAGKGDLIPLGSVTSWLSGGTPNRSNRAYWSGSIPWITAVSLKGTRIYDSDQRVTVEAVRAGSKMAPRGATLLLVRGMALHREVRAGLVLRPVSFNQDVKALVPGRLIQPKYLTYALHAKHGQILKLVSSAGSGTGVLNTSLLKRLMIWLPNADEQTRIVEMIDDIETLIEALSSRLTKAKAIKNGMMQELLAGRTRLPVKEGAA
jgi:type I restriction enzyme S subunit